MYGEEAVLQPGEAAEAADSNVRRDSRHQGAGPRGVVPSPELVEGGPGIGQRLAQVR